MKLRVRVYALPLLKVSALAAEWIEIVKNSFTAISSAVSALAAEWIEISLHTRYIKLVGRLRPRGGVD